MAQKIICHCSLGRQSNRPDRRCNRRKRERESEGRKCVRERERGIERARKEQRTLVEVEIQRKFVH